jgi:hypothetical protein
VKVVIYQTSNKNINKGGMAMHQINHCIILNSKDWFIIAIGMGMHGGCAMTCLLP